MTEKVRGLLGLMMRAGQLKTGEDQSLALVRSGGAAAVLLDAMASENSRKRFSDACAFRKVPLFSLPEDFLAISIGKPGRKVAAVSQSSLAVQLLGQMHINLVEQ